MTAESNRKRRSRKPKARKRGTADLAALAFRLDMQLHELRNPPKLVWAVARPIDGHRFIPCVPFDGASAGRTR